MTADDLKLYADLADMCRKKGIRLLEANGVRLELGPLEAPPSKESKPLDADTCNCGHGLHAHNAATGCLMGCEAEKCMPPGANA